MANEDLRDKIALVTGSTSGIGEAIVVQFSKLGAKVVISGRDEREAQRVSQLCESVSPQKFKNFVYVGDLTNETNVRELFAKTIEFYGKLDVLVNNAGGATLSKISEERFLGDFDRIMNLNTRSPLLLSQLSLPYLVQSKGCIINISSVASMKHFDGLMHYSMAKAAMDKMTKHLASEYGPKGVRVNSVNPGIIKTKIHQRTGYPNSVYEEGTKIYPLRRWGLPEEVAEYVCFLASQKSAFISGTLLPFDGGFNCI